MSAEPMGMTSITPKRNAERDHAIEEIGAPGLYERVDEAAHHADKDDAGSAAAGP